MTHTSLTFEGKNGSFTGVYYKRNGEWFPGVQDNASGKRCFDAAVRSSYAAADASIGRAKKAAGNDAKWGLA